MADQSPLTPEHLAASVYTADLRQFRAIAKAIEGDIIRTPLLPCDAPDRTIRLKAECLQPLGSFKIRAASSVLRSMDRRTLTGGVATASAGNFAQGLALAASRQGIPLTVHAPDTAANIKLAAISALGATIVMHPFADWWSIMTSRDTGADDGVFIHPVCERGVILGNGTIGLELAEDWPDVDTVIVPFGGGGLSCGIALALRSLAHHARVIACEIETSTPVKAALRAGEPVRVERQPSFVDGIGSTVVLPDMWPLVRELIHDSIVVSLDEAKTAVRDLATRHHLVAEGAGAVALAAARSAQFAGKNVAAVISGGNIDPTVLAGILAERSDRGS
jgi:threonine dehydratase